MSPRGTSRPVTPSSTASTNPPTAVAMTGRRTPSPRARPRRSLRDATAQRRSRPARSTGRARRRHEADRLWEERPQRAVADDDERQPTGGLRQLADSLLLRQPTDVEDVRRLVRLADRLGDRDPARDHAHVPRAEPTGIVSKRGRRAHDDLRPTNSHRASGRTRRARATSEPQSWSMSGLPVASAGNADGSQCAWTRSAPGAARRAARANASRKNGRTRTFQGFARRLLTIPSPYAMP